jgi:hypothetical protein
VNDGGDFTSISPHFRVASGANDIPLVMDIEPRPVVQMAILES